MPRTAVKLVETPRKPVSKFSAADHRLLHTPSVEDHLNRIQRAIALCAVVQGGLPYLAEFGLPDGIEDKATEALVLMCNDAWQSARALSEGLPGEVHNLHVVFSGQDEDGGAR